MGSYCFVICCVLFVSTVSSIFVRNEGVKTRTYHRDPQISELLRSQHNQNRQSSSINERNSDYTSETSDTRVNNYQGSSGVYHINQGKQQQSEGRSYAYVGDNSIVSYLTECPPNATGQFAYLYDCRRFLNCWKGRGYIQICAPGTVFNPDTLECDNPKKVVCLGVGSNSKNDKYDSRTGTFARYTQDGQSSSSHIPRAIGVTSTTINGGEVKCTPGFSGMESHPFDCTKFLNCANGITNVQTCGSGTVFNPTLNVCDYPNNVDCGTKSRLTQGNTFGGRSITTTSSTTNTHEAKCRPDANGIEPHPYDCTKFLNCAHGITHIQNCGPGTVFNPEISVCDYPYRVNCGTRTFRDDSSTSSSSTTHYQVRRPVGGNAHQSSTQQTYQQTNEHNTGYRVHTIDLSEDKDVQKSDQFPGNLVQGSSQVHFNTNQQSSGSSYQQPGQGQSVYNHQHTHNREYPNRNFQYNPGQNQQYNWTVTSNSNPSSNRQYNWTRTTITQPGESRQYNWTRTETRYPNQGTTNVYVNTQYPGSTGTSQSWPHQTTGNRVNTGHHGTTFSTDNVRHIEDTQRQERPDWINSLPSSSVGYNPNQYQPHQATSTTSPTINRYWPTFQSSSPSTSTSYDNQQATVQQYPQSNFNNPQKNLSDSGSSSSTTIYYAQPIEDSDEYFDNISGGDLPATDYNIHTVRNQTNTLNSNFRPDESINRRPENVRPPPQSSTDFPVNNSPHSFSSSSNRRDLIFRINTTSIKDSDDSNHYGSPNFTPSSHLLPPFAPTNTKRPRFLPNNNDDSFSSSSNFNNVRINRTSSDYDSNLYGGLLPPYPSVNTETTTIRTPSIYILPPYPPLPTDNSNYTKMFTSTTSIRDSDSEHYGSPIFTPSSHLLPPFASTNTKRPRLLPNDNDDSFSSSSNFHNVRINRTSSDYDSNLYGGLLPPYPSVNTETTSVRTPAIYILPPYPSLPTDSSNYPKNISISGDSFVSSSHNVASHVNSSDDFMISNSNDNQRQQPIYSPSTYDEKPETRDFTRETATIESNVRTFPIYPSSDSTSTSANTSWRPPIYSPSYSSISHSRDWTTHTKSNPSNILPPINQWVHSVNKGIILNPIDTANTEIVTDPYNTNSTPVVVFDREDNQYPSETRVIPLFARPPPPELPQNSPSTYNREYYKQTASTTVDVPLESNTDDISQLPISEAIKALLRPYINRSGTVTEEDVQKAETVIMKIGKSSPDARKETESEFVDEKKIEETKKTEPKNFEKEVELIFTGEQENLSQGASKWNHDHSEAHHRHIHRHGHLHPNDFHSREFHQNHPHLMNPFSSNAGVRPTNTQLNRVSPPPDSETISAPDLYGSANSFRTTTPMYPANRRHDWDYKGTGQTTVHVDQTISGSDNGDFDCRNGKGVKSFEVCDGVNNCGNRMDENYCDHLGYEIRLSNEESSKNMGRVEVKILGKWGYVCDDKFGLRDADVLCRELGFPLGASEVRGNSFYPPHAEMIAPNGDVLFVMDEVDCKGNETSIKECDFKGWGIHDCNADEVVGVVCKVPVMKCPHDFWLCKTSKECIPPAFVCDDVSDCADESDESDAICNSSIEYRLSDGDGRLEGRVEVKYRGVWGSVCDDDFGEAEAHVVCQSLGFFGNSQILKNAFGPGTGPIWLDQVSCFGNETSLDKCSHWTWGEHNCNHTEDVSIKCSVGTGRPTNRDGVGIKGGIKGRSSQLPDFISSEEVDLFPFALERSSKILNKHKTCGVINTNATDEFERSEERLERVVQGSKAKRGHHPWQATIRTRGRSGKSTHWCGAVLISDRHLLTAAHCLAGYGKGAYFVRLGDHYANIAESSEVDVFIENWHIHEQFRKGTHMNNDIALIVLKHPIRFNDYVHPICLPPKDANYDEGRTCVISGWGSIQSGISTPANHLRAAKIPIISQDVCKQPHVYGNSITDGMFCAGYLDESVDACDGDSGGPLVCHNEDYETLFGIISWGQHCGYSNKPGVYVKIAHYIDWIYEKLGIFPDTRGDIR